MRKRVLLGLMCLSLVGAGWAQVSNWPEGSGPAPGREKAETTDTAKTRPTVGLALGGGGAKGAAHIGVLRYLEEVGIPIDYVAGTSIGSIIGGFYSLGYSPYELGRIISDMDWNTMMSSVSERQHLNLAGRRAQDTYLLSVPFNTGEFTHNMSDVFLSSLPSGFISGNRITSLFNSLSVGYSDSMDFNQLPIPFACVATDIKSGNPVVFRSGHLPLAIRSSMAIPAYFSPVHYGNMVLCDGGLTDNLPVDVCRAMGSDIVIGIDVSDPLVDDEQYLRSLPQLIMQFTGIAMRTDVERLQPLCDLYMHPDISGYSALDFNSEAIDELILRGYRAAQAHHDELMAIKEMVDPNNEYHKQLNAPKALTFGTDTMVVNRVYYEGVSKDDERRLVAKGGIYNEMPITRPQLEECIALIEGSGFYTNITYTIEMVDGKDATPRGDIHIRLQPAQPHNFALGLRVDSEESAAVNVHLGFNQFRTKGLQFVIDGRINHNSRIGVRTSYSTNLNHRVELAYDYHNSHFSLSSGYSRDFVNRTVGHHKLQLSFCNTFGRNADLRYGMEEDVSVPDSYLSIGSLGRDDITDLFHAPGHTGPFVQYSFDNFDNRYFPKSGCAFVIDGHWRFSNSDLYQLFHQGVGYLGFADLSASAQTVLALGNRLSIIPQIFTRIVAGSHHELYDNIVGGVLQGRYMDQQLPFVGFGIPQRVGDFTHILRTDFQINLTGNHYLALVGNYLLSADDVHSYWGEGNRLHQALGAALRYSYKIANMGPISVDLNWNSLTHQMGFYFNFGCMF